MLPNVEMINGKTVNYKEDLGIAVSQRNGDIEYTVENFNGTLEATDMGRKETLREPLTAPKNILKKLQKLLGEGAALELFQKVFKAEVSTDTGDTSTTKETDTTTQFDDQMVEDMIGQASVRNVRSDRNVRSYRSGIHNGGVRMSKQYSENELLKDLSNGFLQAEPKTASKDLFNDLIGKTSGRYNRDQLIDAVISGRATSGDKAASLSIFERGGVTLLYSYGTPIAARKGDRFYLNSTKYSTTTSNAQSKIRRAAPMVEEYPEDKFVEVLGIPSEGRMNTNYRPEPDLISSQREAKTVVDEDEYEVAKSKGFPSTEQPKTAIWKDRLQNVYSDVDEWLNYADTYGLAERLGYDDPMEAWDDNPTIQGGTEPADYKKVGQKTAMPADHPNQIAGFIGDSIEKAGEWLAQAPSANWLQDRLVKLLKGGYTRAIAAVDHAIDEYPQLDTPEVERVLQVVRNDPGAAVDDKQIIGQKGGEQLDESWANQSLSTGTMIAEDVFSAIESLLPESIVEEFWAAEEDSEDRMYILNEYAWDHMNDIAPEGTYFGAHPGDGSDFGFWSYDDDDDLEFM